MTQFHEGQDVEVHCWRRAKIVEIIPAIEGKNAIDDAILVQFQDGSTSVFDAEHIRSAPFENPGLNEELQKHEARREIESKSFAGRKGENPSWE